AVRDKAMSDEPEIQENQEDHWRKLAEEFGLEPAPEPPRTGSVVPPVSRPVKPAPPREQPPEPEREPAFSFPREEPQAVPVQAPAIVEPREAPAFERVAEES